VLENKVCIKRMQLPDQRTVSSYPLFLHFNTWVSNNFAVCLEFLNAQFNQSFNHPWILIAKNLINLHNFRLSISPPSHKIWVPRYFAFDTRLNATNELMISLLGYEFAGQTWSLLNCEFLVKYCNCKNNLVTRLWTTAPLRPTPPTIRIYAVPKAEGVFRQLRERQDHERGVGFCF
jgi:hypothetical protein